MKTQIFSELSPVESNFLLSCFEVLMILTSKYFTVFTRILAKLFVDAPSSFKLNGNRKVTPTEKTVHTSILAHSDIYHFVDLCVTNMHWIPTSKPIWTPWLNELFGATYSNWTKIIHDTASFKTSSSFSINKWCSWEICAPEKVHSCSASGYVVYLFVWFKLVYS